MNVVPSSVNPSARVDALRAAKKWLRSDESGEDPEVQDWAAWVLTGHDE